MKDTSADGNRTGLALWLALLPLFAQAHAASAQPIPTGIAQRTVEIAGTTVELHTYKPQNYDGGPLLVTLHGVNRNAAGYLRYSRPLADRFGFLLVAPLFDRERFPTWRYQHGGIVHADAAGGVSIEPEAQGTGRLVLRLVEAIRAMESNTELPYLLTGHSAGAQLLSRVAAFVPNHAQRIVIANAGTYLWPARALRFPFGFGGLPEALSNDDAIRRYLAQPLVLFLGDRDTQRDSTLNVRESAMQQGATRHERGLNFYRTAQKIARENGWAFNWRLVEAHGVGHSARRMYASNSAQLAFGGD